MTHSPDSGLPTTSTACTKANTELSPWWLALNTELAKLGQPEARFGDVRDYYENGDTPEAAAKHMAAQA